MVFNDSFFLNKRVLITGHTGFKGSWLCQILHKLGADVYGYSLKPLEKSLFEIAGISSICHSCFGDIRDYSSLRSFFVDSAPEIVIHMAAQPLVRESYIDPRYTYETNVMGTVNILECIRATTGVKTVLNVTTDKVYENSEKPCYAFKETDPLDGFDPYSNSKSCSELVTHSYQKSFFSDNYVSISTARAGNVIGGGDFAKDRIIPDCVDAAKNKRKIYVRNPKSIRPYQHVLEPLFVYLMIVEKQYNDPSYSGYYNVGPDLEDCFRTEDLVNLFIKYWGEGISWESDELVNQPHEASFLRLDCSKLKQVFSWTPTWNIEKAVEKTVEWSKCWISGGDIRYCMNKQIEEFICEM